MDDELPYQSMERDSPYPSDDANKIADKKIKQYKLITTVFFLLSVVFLVLLVCSISLKFGCHLSAANKEKIKQASIIKFFHVSDIHLDLKYNSTSSNTLCHPQINGTSKPAPFPAPYGRILCDSPKILVESALRFMKKVSTSVEDKVDFFVFTGDQVVHGIEREPGNGTVFQRVIRNINATSGLIAKEFGNVPVLPSFGNNDLPGDYVLPKDSVFYETVLSIWQPLILCSKCSLKVTTEEELKKTFLTGGYYKAKIKGANIILLQLNTNYWNVHCIRKNPGSRKFEIADAQMKWVEDQLKEVQSSGYKAIISGHIPPGIDAFGKNDAFWAQNYTQKYVELVTKTYKDTVIGQLYGHIHKDDMKIQMSNDKVGGTDESTAFLLTAPGITPIYKNNPGFRVVSFDMERKMLTDYNQYYMDLVLTAQNNVPIWLYDYSFSQKYMKDLPENEKVITGKTVAKIVENFINPTNMNKDWQTYIQHRQVNYQPDPYSRYLLYCAVRHVNKKVFDDCVKRYPVTGG